MNMFQILLNVYMALNYYEYDGFIELDETF